MASFLSEEWFAEVNERLTSRTLDVPTAEETSIVLEFDGGSSSDVHALTLHLCSGGARITPGDHLAATTVFRLSASDAAALSNGTLDSATALREGRLKVTGDLRALLEWSPWLGDILATPPNAAEA